MGVGMSTDSPTIESTAVLVLTRKLGAPPACGGVLGHLGCQNVDIETLAKLVSHGRLDLSRSVSEIIALEDLPSGIEKLERQEGNRS
jgi:threonine dehydrogenase-like Zn-dependent dehydrogenase